MSVRPTYRPSVAPVGPFFDLIVMGASAGGISALLSILPALPGDLPAAIAVALHRAPNRPDLLTEIFGRRTSLRVKQAEDGEAISRRSFYIGPAGSHLVVNDDYNFGLSIEGREFARPSVDRLFSSAAAVFGSRLIAVVLSGAGNDGGIGVRTVKECGGVVIVADTPPCRDSATA